MTQVLCPLCCQDIAVDAGRHVCDTAAAICADASCATLDAEGPSPGPSSTVCFNGQLDEEAAADVSRPSLSEWKRGMRVTTRCVLAGCDKVEVPAGSVGRVWQTLDEEGLLLVFIDFPEDTMKGYVMRAEPSDLEVHGFLDRGTKIMCLPMFCNTEGRERQMDRGATGMVREYLPEIEKYSVWFDDGFEARVPVQLVQPRKGAKVRYTGKKTGPTLLKTKSALARAFGKLQAPGFLERRLSARSANSSFSGSDDCGSSMSSSPRSVLKSRSRLHPGLASGSFSSSLSVLSMSYEGMNSMDLSTSSTQEIATPSTPQGIIRTQSRFAMLAAHTPLVQRVKA